MKMKTLMGIAACVVLAAGITSCEKDSPDQPAQTTVSVTDSIKVPFASTSSYVLYSFKDSAIVPNSDSATTKWDFGMRYVQMIVNSHASGPGSAGVISQSGIYADYNTAPTSGYAYDTTSTKLAVTWNPFDPNCWYLYNPTMHTAQPKAGQFFVFHTADNKYVKMEVTGITYADFVSQTEPPKSIIYKFRYVYQKDGSVQLNN